MLHNFFQDVFGLGDKTGRISFFQPGFQQLIRRKFESTRVGKNHIHDARGILLVLE